MAQPATKRAITESDISQLRQVYKEVYAAANDAKTSQKDYLNYRKVMSNIKLILNKFSD